MMNTVPVQCQCGAVVQVARDPRAAGMRCPSCGVMVSASSRRSAAGEPNRSSGPDRGSAAQHDLDFDEDGAGYEVAAESGGESRGNTGEQNATWVPVRGRAVTGRGRTSLAGRTSGAGDLHTRIGSSRVDLPGPFFSWSAFVYIFLFPTWARWLGLSFMSLLAAGAIAVTLFVSLIVIRFQLFLSVFAISSMTMLNLALVSYVIACFVEVIEETVAGEDRLHQLIDMSWWDILPRFFRVVGAAAVAFAITWALTTPLGHWFPQDVVQIIRMVIWLQFFPILLLTNLVDSTLLPYRSLVVTLSRLAARVGYFAAFQSMAFAMSAALLWGVGALYRWHWIAALCASGPAAAAWLLYYGHWLGRLGRQLVDAD